MDNKFLLMLVLGVVFTSGCIELLVGYQMSKFKPTYELPQYILNYDIVFNEDLSARINFTMNISRDPKYFRYDFYLFTLPQDAVLIDLYDTLGKIKNYDIIEKNETSVSARSFVHSNGTRIYENITVENYYKELNFTANDMESNDTHIITTVFLTNYSYTNSTPLFYGLYIPIFHFLTGGPKFINNLKVVLPDNFYFIPQKTDIRAGNYLVSENKNALTMKAVDMNPKSISQPSLGFFKNATAGNWTLLELNNYVVSIETPSQKQIDELKAADEFFYILENITGFQSQYSKFVAEIFDFPEGFCGHDVACAGIVGFVAKPYAVKADTIIHESMHAFQLQIKNGVKLKEAAAWFDEGTATYVANLFAESYADKYKSYNYSLRKLDYNSVKEFYLIGNKTTDNVDFFYDYSAYTFAAYVQECGKDALKKIFQNLKSRADKIVDFYYMTTEEFIQIMGDACNRTFTEDEIDYPYKELLLTNETAFKEKIKNLVIIP